MAQAREIEESVAPPVGESAVGREASELVRALVKASRSVILYDAANQTVHDFLQELRARLERFLATSGPLVLLIRPYDLVRNGEVVYHERERERSLALRLYRDGVRRISIAPDVTWEEVSQLVGILAVRFKGVRLQEEDIVTMMWKASFDHIKVEAVEGFVTAEDGLDSGPYNAMRAAALRAPFVFEEPWPQLPTRSPVAFAPLSAAALEGIAREDSEAALPADCLALVREVTAALADPAAELASADVTSLLHEMREFLVGEGRTAEVLAMARTVAAGLPAAEGRQRSEALLACIDGATLRTLLGSGIDATSLAGVLDEAHLDIMLDLLIEERGDGIDRDRLAGLVERAAASHADTLRARLLSAGGEGGARLLRVLQRLSPDDAVQAAVAALSRDDPVLQREALQVLRGAAYGPKVGRALVGALEAANEEVRLSALQLLVKQRERRAFPPLVERIRRLAPGSVSEREAGACGAALALLDGNEAIALFRSWVKPPGGLLGKVIPRSPLLLAVAAGGLARLAGDEPDELLASLARNGPEEVRAACQAQLERRRQSRP